ncbi:hypothetical protein GCM10028784_24850 [Myceligenerans cantabricum]
MGLFDKAKELATDPATIAKVRELATDENVDKVTDKLKDVAPEQARGAIDGLAGKAKEWGGEDEAPDAAGSGHASEAATEPAAGGDEEQDRRLDAEPGPRGAGRQGDGAHQQGE